MEVETSVAIFAKIRLASTAEVEGMSAFADENSMQLSGWLGTLLDYADNAVQRLRVKECNVAVCVLRTLLFIVQ